MYQTVAPNYLLIIAGWRW